MMGRGFELPPRISSASRSTSTPAKSHCYAITAIQFLLFLMLSGCLLVGHSGRNTPDIPQDTNPASITPLPSDEITRQMFRNEYLLGDWDNARTWLALHGIEPTALIISDPFGNLTGGQQRGATDYNLAGVDILLDTQKLFGLRGGEFHIGGAVNFGTSLSAKYIGNSFPVQLADVATSQPRLTYLSYTHLLDEGKVSFRIGRLTVNSVTDEEFMGSEYFKLLSSVGFDLIPQSLFFDANGASGYPHTTWGTRLRYIFSDCVYVQAGAYNGDVKQRNGDQHGVDFSLRGPLFTIAELGLRWNSGPQDTGLARNLKFGAYYNGGTYTQAKPQTIQNVSGLYGLYFVGDQQLWHWHEDKHGPPGHPENTSYSDAQRDRHLGIFGVFTAEPQARLNTVPYFFDGGVAAYGPSAERPRDFAALGIVYGSFKNTPQRLLQVTPLIAPSSNEETLEATYGFAVRPGLLFQPSLQWMIHPRGNISIPSALPPGSSVPNALAFGSNIVVNF